MMKSIALALAATALTAGAADARPTDHAAKTKPAKHHDARVVAKTSTGKTVKYDCSKPGNATKKACRS